MTDFNTLEVRALTHIEKKEFESALAIYLYMADGDPSLDGGYLGNRIGFAYQQMGRTAEAKYWFGRAAEENPALYGIHDLSSVRWEEISNIA